VLVRRFWVDRRQARAGARWWLFKDLAVATCLADDLSRRVPAPAWLTCWL